MADCCWTAHSKNCSSFSWSASYLHVYILHSIFTLIQSSTYQTMLLYELHWPRMQAVPDRHQFFQILQGSSNFCKTQRVLYFLNAGGSRISNMTFPCVIKVVKVMRISLHICISLEIALPFFTFLCIILNLSAFLSKLLCLSLHFSALFCVYLHFSTFLSKLLCLSLHFSALFCIYLHFSAFLCIYQSKYDIHVCHEGLCISVNSSTFLLHFSAFFFTSQRFSTFEHFFAFLYISLH